MSQFAIHTLDSAPVATRPALEAARARFGFLPNLLGELAAAPTALQAYLTLNELVGKTSFSAPAQQVILITVSRANGCQYCVAAHTAGAKMAGLADDQIDAVRHGGPLVDPHLEALRAFTHAVVEQRGHVSNAQLRRFLEAGHSHAQVFEVLVGVAMKTLSNYTNHIADTPLDPQLQPFAWELAAV